MDHVVLVLFENRSLDNLLGHLYGPADGKTFEGVIGKGLSNPIPEWAEHGAERKTVPYTVGTDMDAPNPDSGEEYFHTNMGGGMIEHAKQAGIAIPPELADPTSPPSAEQIIAFLRTITARFFPRLAATTAS